MNGPESNNLWASRTGQRVTVRASIMGQRVTKLGVGVVGMTVCNSVWKFTSVLPIHHKHTHIQHKKREVRV